MTNARYLAIYVFYWKWHNVYQWIYCCILTWAAQFVNAVIPGPFSGVWRLAAGIHATDDICHCYSNSGKILFCSHLNSNNLITTKMCIWHNSLVVVACAQFCSDVITQNGITATLIVHWWIVVENHEWNGQLVYTVLPGQQNWNGISLHLLINQDLWGAEMKRY